MDSNKVEAENSVPKRIGHRRPPGNLVQSAVMCAVSAAEGDLPPNLLKAMMVSANGVFLAISQGVIVGAASDVGEIRDYDPNRLLDELLVNLRLKNDAALSRMLEVAPPVISGIRHGRLPVRGAMLIRMHEVSGLELTDLRYLMGDRRSKFRVSSVPGRPK